MLVGFDFSPKQVDTSTSATNVTFSLHVSDDVSGVGWFRVDATSPSSKVILDESVNPAVPISGPHSTELFR